jgi:hypothetical protein
MFFEETSTFSGVKTIPAGEKLTMIGDLFHQMSPQEQAAYGDAFRQGAQSLVEGLKTSGALKTGMSVARWGGNIAMAASYGVALSDAMDAAERGEVTSARNIMLKWTASTEGALLAGALAGRDFIR